MNQGDAFHGEVDSLNAVGGVAFTLYEAGNTVAFTLEADDFLTITDVVFISTAGGTYSVAMPTQAAGKYVVKGNAEALGGLAHQFGTPIACPKGVTPKLFAAIGQVDCVISGFRTRV